MRKLMIMALAELFFLTGCAHLISNQSRVLADRSITFSRLLEAPDAYRGRFVMLGGTIATVKHTREGTLLEVVQYNLDSRELPDEATRSGGRFMATTPASLDPDKYAPGALVSMAGEVVGKKVQPMQGVEYVYPVIDIKEIHDIVIEQETRWGSFGGM